MNSYETQYRELVIKILNSGEVREGRNGTTRSIFGETITIDMDEGFPLLLGRKLYYKGVMGELAAMLRKPKTIKDFKDQGCNYWELWGKEDGTINVDYGNKWLDWNGVDQLKKVLHTIKTNPHDRRMIVTGWDPTNLDNLDLPCCHYAYQWYVRDGKYLDMIWHQRSVDTMIGLPSDVIFAASWLIAMAAETELVPGRITFTLGDTHIYREHFEGAWEYLDASRNIGFMPTWEHNSNKETVEFNSADIEIINYFPKDQIKFELKS